MQINSLVCLKASSNVVMMVTSVLADEETVICQWINVENQELQTAEFKIHVLKSLDKLNQNEKFEIYEGQAVELSIGSKIIKDVVVQAITNDETVICQWFSKNPQTLQTEIAHISLLKRKTKIIKDLGLRMSY